MTGLQPTRKGILQRFITFSGVGAIGTSAHYLTLFALVRGLGVNPVVASGAGFVVGGIVNYVINYHYTFQSQKGHREAASKFFVIAGIGFLLNVLLMYILVTTLGAHYFAAQVIATASVIVWGFFGNHTWTFR